MIGYLRGELLESSPERLLILVGGVGYRVSVPLPTFYEVERLGVGSTVELRIHSHVREDAFELYGFWNEREKTLFEKLISVSGIGPKLARVILSGMPVDDLLAIVAQGDVTSLTRIPGVGKKTAERIVLEVQDKVQDLAKDLAPAPLGAGHDDLLAALENLGYKRSLADKALSRVLEEAPEAEFHELLRRTLSRLSRA